MRSVNTTLFSQPRGARLPTLRGSARQLRERPREITPTRWATASGEGDEGGGRQPGGTSPCGRRAPKRCGVGRDQRHTNAEGRRGCRERLVAVRACASVPACAARGSALARRSPSRSTTWAAPVWVPRVGRAVGPRRGCATPQPRTAPPTARLPTPVVPLLDNDSRAWAVAAAHDGSAAARDTAGSSPPRGSGSSGRCGAAW